MPNQWKQAIAKPNNLQQQIGNPGVCICMLLIVMLFGKQITVAAQ
jgi:hypothetical protein